MRYFWILGFCLIGLSAFSQVEKRKVVILYNTEPLNATVGTDGVVYEIHGKAENYLKGYKVVKSKYQPADQKDAKYYKPSGEYVVGLESRTLLFPNGNATLSRASIDGLDEMIVKLFAGTERTKLLVTPYMAVENDKQSELLLQNRMNACLTYLALRGITRDQIVINEDISTVQREEIIITTID